MSTVRWLQISDLHYGYESYATIEMRTNMLKSLPGFLEKEKTPPEYLFITGDIRYGKKCGNEFPLEIVDDIKKLMTAFNIPPPRVHIVMGNHDVVREFGRPKIAPLLRKEYENNGNLDNDDLKTLELSQHKFYEVYKSICERDPAPYHSLFEEKDFNIICINTSFASSNDGEDGDLLVGMQLVQKTLAKID